VILASQQGKMHFIWTYKETETGTQEAGLGGVVQVTQTETEVPRQSESKEQVSETKDASSEKQ
jgi:dihydroorotase-like cyclic amidohydrolase